ncbi:BTAD domain-containing putative transcriptional regulator [Nonomuraea sp. NPDC005692]|uniref:AfsR/SARP family transcriptional regulator n=1 Tax=Nonomuraea sp. NPDC005692 TaxID=3157168 RepID=UPI0033F2284B
MTLRIEILGSLRAHRGQAELDLGPAQQRSVLAVLALAEGRCTPMSELVDVLWGERSPVTAVNVLHTYVKRLRRILEPDRPSRVASRLLPRVGDGYLLSTDEVEVDLWKFRALARQGGGHDAVRRAVALWRGQPLAELRPLAGHPLLAGLAQELIVALETFAESAVLNGHAVDVLPLAEEIGRMAPLDERVHSVLIELYLATGRRAEALMHYRDISRRLDEELGVRPGAQLSAAHELALHADTLQPGKQQAAKPQAGRPPVAPGWGRLPVPAQLPPDISDFSGRLGQLSALSRILGSPADGRTAMPTAVVTGLGGVGKTTLAVHLGHLVRENFPDGQLFVDLHGTDRPAADPAAVLHRLLMSMGVNGAVIPKELDDRVALYRSRMAGRRVLLVLDNAVEESQVRPLLPGAATCATVVTSRSRLMGLSGAHRLDLDVFTADEAMDLLVHLIGEQRVRGEGDAARAILEACGHIPLAVRVAGARLAAQPQLSLERFRRQLSNERRRLDHLSAGDLAVRATFGLSYDALPPAVRRAFRVLGLLDVADFADWTLAALLDEPQDQAERLLDQLIDVQLVSVADEDETGEPRYRMHDLIKLYAAERAALEDDEAAREEARVRAYATWLSLAEQADTELAYRTLPALRGPAPRRRLPAEHTGLLLDDPVKWFQSERANLAVVITQSAREGRADLAWNLAEACVGFHEMRDLLEESQAVHAAAMAACGEDVPRGRAVMARNLAYLFSVPMIQPIAMHEHAQIALDLFRSVGDVRGEIHALAMLGTAVLAEGHDEGHGEEGLELMHLAQRLTREHGHDAGFDFVHAGLGFSYRERGELELASAHLEQVVERARDRKVNRLHLTALRSLGMVRHYQGRYDESREALLQGLRLSRSLGVRLKELLALVVLGESGVLTGQPDADSFLDTAEELGEEMAGEITRAIVSRSLATRDLVNGHFEQARERLLFSLRVFRELGVLHLQAMVLKALGIAHVMLGENAQALAAWEEARGLYGRIGNRHEMGEIETLVAGVTG